MIESSMQLTSDETQPDANDVQRWDKIRGNRTSKYGKSPVNISASPKHITKHRSGDRKMIKTKNNSFDRGNGKKETIISRFSNDGSVERVRGKIFASSSSPLRVVRQEVTTCPASPVDPPFASYITTEYVTPLGVCGEEWRSLQMALKGCALDIQHTDLRDLLAGSTGHAEDIAVG